MTIQIKIQAFICTKLYFGVLVNRLRVSNPVRGTRVDQIHPHLQRFNTTYTNSHSNIILAVKTHQCCFNNLHFLSLSIPSMFYLTSPFHLPFLLFTLSFFFQTYLSPFTKYRSHVSCVTSCPNLY